GKGPWRSFVAQLTPMYFWHYDGRPFRTGVETFAQIQTRTDWSFGFNAQRFLFDGQRDETYGISITRNVSNRFRRIGIEAQTGTLANHPSTFIGPTFSLRLLRKLDVSYGGAIQHLEGTAQQHVMTFSYELTPTRS